MLLMLGLSGCKPKTLERTVRVVDAKTSSPVTNGTFLFFHTPALAPYAKTLPPVEAELDAKGEARVVLPLVRNWTRYDENGLHHGTQLEPENITTGGIYKLYDPPPTPGDQRIYESQYVLEIRIP